MRHFIYSLIILFFTTLRASAKLIVIDIRQTLAEATVIRSVVVIGYKDSMMLYRLENSKDTLRVLCKTRSFSEPFRLLLIEKKVMNLG